MGERVIDIYDMFRTLFVSKFKIMCKTKVWCV